MYLSNTHLALIVVLLIGVLFYRYLTFKSPFKVSEKQFKEIETEYNTGNPQFSKIKEIVPSATAVEFKDMHELKKISKLTRENVLKL